MTEINASNDPNVRNKYGMTQAQWNDYQAELQTQENWARTGPMYYQWAHQLNGLNQGVSPSDNLSPVYGNFEPVSTAVSSVDVYNQGVQAEQAKDKVRQDKFIQDIDNQSAANYQKQQDFEAAGRPGEVISKGKSAPVTNRGRTAAQIAARNSAKFENTSGGGFVTVKDPTTGRTNLETQAAEYAAEQAAKLAEQATPINLTQKRIDESRKLFNPLSNQGFSNTSGLLSRGEDGEIHINAGDQTRFNDIQQFKTIDQLKTEKTAEGLDAYRKAHPSRAAGIIADVYEATTDLDALQRTEQKMNGGVFDNLTGKILPTQDKIASSRDTALEKVGLLDAHRAARDTVNNNVWGKALGEFSLDTYDFIREKPVSASKEAAILAGEMYAVGAVTQTGTIAGRVGLEGAGGIASKLPIVGGKVGATIKGSSKLVEPGVAVTLLGGMAADTYGDYKEGDYKGVIKSVSEIGLGGAVFGEGAKLPYKAIDRWRTAGQKEISAESVIQREVLTGQSMVPLSEKGITPEEFIKTFEVDGVSKGYHATQTKFPKKTTAKDSPTRDDMPGLYITPEKAGVNIHFTRTGKGESSYTPLIQGVGEMVSGAAHLKTSEVKAGVQKISDAVLGTQEPLKPTILHVELAGKVERMPEDLRFGGGKRDPKKLEAQRDFFRLEAGTGKTFLPPKLEKGLRGGEGRAETEAVITPGTELVKQGTEGYIIFNGRRIEIDAYKANAAEKPTSLKDSAPNTTKAEDLLKMEGIHYENIGKESYFSKTIKYSSTLKYQQTGITGERAHSKTSEIKQRAEKEPYYSQPHKTERSRVIGTNYSELRYTKSDYSEGGHTSRASTTNHSEPRYAKSDYSEINSYSRVPHSETGKKSTVEKISGVPIPSKTNHPYSFAPYYSGGAHTPSHPGGKTNYQPYPFYGGEGGSGGIGGGSGGIGSHNKGGEGEKYKIQEDSSRTHQKPRNNSIKWKEYTKKHYVVDPMTFVLGKRGKK